MKVRLAWGAPAITLVLRSRRQAIRNLWGGSRLLALYFFPFLFACSLVIPVQGRVLSLAFFSGPNFSVDPLTVRISTQKLLCPEHLVGSPGTKCPQVKAPTEDSAPGAGGTDSSEEHPLRPPWSHSPGLTLAFCQP